MIEGKVNQWNLLILVFDLAVIFLNRKYGWDYIVQIICLMNRLNRFCK